MTIIVQMFNKKINKYNTDSTKLKKTENKQN